jgi:hypothetical protein
MIDSLEHQHQGQSATTLSKRLLCRTKRAGSLR